MPINAGAAVIIADGPKTDLATELAELQNMAHNPLTIFFVNRAIHRLEVDGHYLVTGHEEVAYAYSGYPISVLLSQPQSRWEPYNPRIQRFNNIRKGGSSAFDAVQIAQQIGYTKIVTIGVELEDDYFGFRLNWYKYRHLITSELRGMSGFVADTYGKPTKAWMENGNG